MSGFLHCWTPADHQKGTTENLQSAAIDDFLVGEPSEKVEDSMAGIYSAEVLQLLRQQGHFSGNSEADRDLTQPTVKKIFFASRTHSQLSQFAAELKKVVFPDLDGVVSDSGVSTTAAFEPAKQIALASRKNLCINSAVSSLPSEALNEACLALQDSKTSTTRKCKFLPKEDSLQLQFRDSALADIKDMEDLVDLGKRLGVCPYYSSRLAIPASEIVTLPYPLLLNKTARGTLGIDLKDNVVIIDEAHNLIDAITSIASATVSLPQLSKSVAALEIYIGKFSKRVNGTNKMYIDQLLLLLRKLIGFLSDKKGDGQVKSIELLQRGGDSVNVFKICDYLRTSKLARKVDGLCQFLDTEKEGSESSASTTPVLITVENFLECLANPSDEGQFFFKTTETGVLTLEYMLLDPSYIFADVVKDARSIVLAGGTMEPMSDYIDFLFPAARDRVQFFSCGHVVPKENLTALILGSGAAKKTFEFTFDKRLDRSTLEDLGRSIANLVSPIPDGVVVFFGSYTYLDQVVQIWQQSGIFDTLNNKKPVFREPRGTSVDEVWSAYTASVNDGKGGLLLAVVGGKMSEGINFSDSLGRAVIMIGLPFPNMHTAEWQAKMKYTQSVTASRLVAAGTLRCEADRLGKVAGQEYYENAAMRAVNQSIGRVIRHANDYAMVFLVDVRYGAPKIQGKLPGWIRTGLVPDVLTFGPAMQRTGQFFRSKRK